MSSLPNFCKQKKRMNKLVKINVGNFALKGTLSSFKNQILYLYNGPKNQKKMKEFRKSSDSRLKISTENIHTQSWKSCKSRHASKFKKVKTHVFTKNIRPFQAKILIKELVKVVKMKCSYMQIILRYIQS